MVKHRLQPKILVEQQRLYNMELERLADPMGSDVGLLVQQKELQEVIRSYTENMKAAGGSGFTVKQIR